MSVKTTVSTTVAAEPVLSAAGVTAVVTAGIALLVAFGVPITDAQTVAVIGFVGVLGPIVAAVWARRRVTPVSAGQHRA